MSSRPCPSFSDHSSAPSGLMPALRSPEPMVMNSSAMRCNLLAVRHRAISRRSEPIAGQEIAESKESGAANQARNHALSQRVEGAAGRKSDEMDWRGCAAALFDGRPGAGTGEEGRHAEERSEEHTSELQSLMRISYAVFCLKKKKNKHK